MFQKLVPNVQVRDLRAGAMFLLLVAILLTLGALAGCEGKAFDKETGREVTGPEALALADQREARAIRERQKAEAQAAVDLANAAAEKKDAIRAAELEAQGKADAVRIEQARKRGQFKTATKALELQYQADLANLSSLYETSQEELLVALKQVEGAFALATERAGDEYERRSSAASARIAEAKGAEMDALQRNEATVNNQLAEIQRENDRMLGLAKVVQGIPGVGAAAGAAGINMDDIAKIIFGGAMGGGVLTWRGRKRQDQARADADAAYEEGRRVAMEEARVQREREHAAWDEAQARALAMATSTRSD